MPIPWNTFAELIKKHDRFILTSHMRPDCDALGSELGMRFILQSLGKDVLILNGDTVPPHIAFIDPKNKVKTLGQDVAADSLAKYDALMVLDTSAWVQLGPMADVVRNFSGTKIVLDHHVSSDDLDAHEFKNTTAEATGRLVLEAADALGVSLTAEAAMPLFAAIATDTGWFRFSSVGSETYAAVAKLVAAGVQPSQVFSFLYEQNSLARLRLQGRILQSADGILDGTVLFAEATLSDFAETAALPTDTEDVVNRLLTIQEAECALLFVELATNKTKVSLRSQGTFDVSAIAEQFGGGGHKAASGVSMDKSLAETKTLLLEAIKLARS